jgi:hypothetical protein
MSPGCTVTLIFGWLKCPVKECLNGKKPWEGLHWDVGNAVIQTSDGGYAVSGYVSSDDGNVTGFHGMFDYWVAKLSSTGDLEWQKALGGSEIDQGRSLVNSGDGGYVIMGGTQSSNGDVIGNNGGAEYWIVKLDSTRPTRMATNLWRFYGRSWLCHLQYQ